MSATQLLYQTTYPLPGKKAGRCSMCGGDGYDLQTVTTALAYTFNDQSFLRPGDGICVACRWFLSGKSTELQALLGRDKPQKPVNYSHICRYGRWLIYSKAQKREIAAQLLMDSLPEVCALAESGQKHVVFKTRTNAPNSPCGWICFEGEHLWLEQGEFAALYTPIQRLYQARYNKTAILSGNYTFYPDSDLTIWGECEPQIEATRGSLLFILAVYLAQLKEEPHSGSNSDE